jgi:hypothetical protein
VGIARRHSDDPDNANGWENGNDIVSGGSGWPEGLYAWSGGCVAYVRGQAYFCIFGGGHAIGPDNSIYAFGPLFGTGSDTPAWSRLGPQSPDSAVRDCQQRYADGRPSARHSIDLCYGKGYIMLLWQNARYCSGGGTTPGIDAFDVAAGEWDQAKSPPRTHQNHNLPDVTHSPGCFHPHDGLFYAKGSGSGFGSYDPVSRVFNDIEPSGPTQASDSFMCTLGPRDYLFCARASGDPSIRINTKTGACQSWATSGFPGRTESAFAYDSARDRIYTPTTGVSSNISGQPAGSKTVAWFNAGATSSPTWVAETFNGDTPDQQVSTGTYGRWAYIPELRGFVLNNGYDSPIYFYRTSP